MPDGELAVERMHVAGDEIAAAVEQRLPAWVVTQVARILDAWGSADADVRARAEREAVAAGAAAATRITDDLRELVALDPLEHATTPLELVRSAYREPTVVLEAAGIPPVVRDPFEERSWPDDHYGLVLRTFADLPDDEGEDDLGPLHLAWGLAKSAAVRAEGRGSSGDPEERSK